MLYLTFMISCTGTLNLWQIPDPCKFSVYFLFEDFMLKALDNYKTLCLFFLEEELSPGIFGSCLLDPPQVFTHSLLCLYFWIF